MKKNIRILSVIICVVMLVSLIAGISVSAANYKTGNYKGKFDYIITNKEVIITNINKSLKELTIPSKIDGYPVTAIGESACKCGSLKILNLPDTLVTIGDYAFMANYIEDIVVPSGVRYIGEKAFYGFFYSSNSIKSITMNEGLESIGEYAFDGLYLKSVTIPSTVWWIGKGAFADVDTLYIMSMYPMISGLPVAYDSTIYGYDNSMVAYYATEEGWKFKSLGKYTGISLQYDTVYGFKNSEFVFGKAFFDGKMYWFKDYGPAYTGLTKMSNGDLYYFSKKHENLGQALTGWVKIGDKKYYFRTSGENKYKAAKGWMKIKGEKYYFYSDGTMATGKVKINGKTYSFDKNGKLK